VGDEHQGLDLKWRNKVEKRAGPASWAVVNRDLVLGQELKIKRALMENSVPQTSCNG
jgi:hypothetical protein